MRNIGLVLPGGGMRGVYTSGVLDFFMDHKIHFPYVIGVSAGACNGSAYISKQKGFGKIVHMKYLNDSRYLSFKNLFNKSSSILGMDFIFDEIPNNLEPFDFDTFNKSSTKFIVTATDCNTGKAVYFDKDKCNDIFKAIRASSSLPFFSPMVEYLDMKLLDGGLSDPIPLKKSEEDGNVKNIIILTNNIRCMKKFIFFSKLANRIYYDYKEIVNAIDNCHKIHNETLDYIKKQKKNNKVFIISPSKSIKLNIIDKNYKKMNELYEMGYEDAKNSHNDLKKFLDDDYYLQ